MSAQIPHIAITVAEWALPEEDKTTITQKINHYLVNNSFNKALRTFEAYDATLKDGFKIAEILCDHPQASQVVTAIRIGWAVERLLNQNIQKVTNSTTLAIKLLEKGQAAVAYSLLSLSICRGWIEPEEAAPLFLKICQELSIYLPTQAACAWKFAYACGIWGYTYEHVQIVRELKKSCFNSEFDLYLNSKKALALVFDEMLEDKKQRAELYQLLKDGEHPDYLLSLFEKYEGQTWLRNSYPLLMRRWAQEGRYPEMARLKKMLDKRQVRFNLPLAKELLSNEKPEIYELFWSDSRLHTMTTPLMAKFGWAERLATVNCPLDGEIYEQVAMNAELDVAMGIYAKLVNPSTQLRSAITKRLQNAGRHEEAAGWISNDNAVDGVRNTIRNLKNPREALRLLKSHNLPDSDLWEQTLKNIPKKNRELQREACKAWAALQNNDMRCWRLVIAMQKRTPDSGVINAALNVPEEDKVFARDLLEVCIQLPKEKRNIGQMIDLYLKAGKLSSETNRKLIEIFPPAHAWEIVEREMQRDGKNLASYIPALMARSPNEELQDQRMQSIRKNIPNLDANKCSKALIRENGVISYEHAIAFLKSTRNPDPILVKIMIRTADCEKEFSELKPLAKTLPLKRSHAVYRLRAVASRPNCGKEVRKSVYKQFFTHDQEFCIETLEDLIQISIHFLEIDNDIALFEEMFKKIKRTSIPSVEWFQTVIATKNPKTEQVLQHLRPYATFLQLYVDVLANRDIKRVYELMSEEMNSLTNLAMESTKEFMFGLFKPWWSLRPDESLAEKHFTDCSKQVKECAANVRVPTEVLYTLNQNIIATKNSKLIHYALQNLLIGTTNDEDRVARYREVLKLMDNQSFDVTKSVSECIMQRIFLETEHLKDKSKITYFEKITTLFLMKSILAARKFQGVERMRILNQNLAMLHLVIPKGIFSGKITQILGVIQLMKPMYSELKKNGELISFLKRNQPSEPNERWEKLIQDLTHG